MIRIMFNIDNIKIDNVRGKIPFCPAIMITIIFNVDNIDNILLIVIIAN